MSGWQALDQFLQTDPRDVGCDEAMNVLHIYVDIVNADGADAAERRFAGVAVHLRSCGPCGEDFAGLLAAVTGNASLGNCSPVPQPVNDLHAGRIGDLGRPACRPG
jgi:hypothetical protein